MRGKHEKSKSTNYYMKKSICIRPKEIEDSISSIESIPNELSCDPTIENIKLPKKENSVTFYNEKRLKISELLLSPEMMSKIKSPEQPSEIKGELFDKLYKDYFLFKEKHNLNKELYEKEKMRECTFNPQTNRNKSESCYEKRRSFEEFYDYQRSFQARLACKRLKQKEKQYNISASFSYRPEISQKSKELVKISEGGSVHERLFSGRTSRKPEKNKEKSKDLSKNNNQKREILVANKFFKEFDSVLSEKSIICMIKEENYEIKGENDMNLVGIDYLIFTKILEKLGYLQRKDKIQQERSLAASIWSILQEDESKKKVLVCNLKILLLAIEGINFHKICGEGEIEEQDNNSLGRFDKFGVLQLTDSNVKQLQNKFEALCRNRLVSEKLRKTKSKEEFTFKPKLSETSIKIAEFNREKLTKRTKELLIKEGEFKLPKHRELELNDIYQLQRQAKNKELEELFIKKKEQEEKSCTFRPSISVCKSSSRMFHNLDKKKEKRPDKTTEQVNYEKNCEECTFKPNLNKDNNKNKKNTINKNPSSENFANRAIGRIRAAWEEKEKVNNFLKKGIPIKRESKIKAQKLIKKKKTVVNDENKMPLLFVDVNMGNGLDRIVIFDNSKVKNLAESFCKKHKLDKGMIGKLENLLNEQIKKVLGKIDEDQEECSNEISK